MSNPIINSLLNHRSIRKFKPDPIPDETIELILRAGTRAASAGNLQAYSFVVVDEPDLVKKLGFSAPIAVVALVDQYRLKRWFELNDAPFYNDQAINLFISYWDAVIALQNAVVAAESLNLGTVYVGMILSTNVQEVLGAPEYVFPAGLVFLGYPDEEPLLRPRLPLAAIVHRNRYHVPSDEEITDFYRERDAQWDEINQARREKLEEKGITNFAQAVTLGHYTPKFIESESRKLIENIKRAGFHLLET
ncbi:MAG TPA: hypothetical protein ENH11_07235 [Candidatus Acetothermia bacterium]|nr:hypothetical protein [Candidatus Acetothermia bacterium]